MESPTETFETAMSQSINSIARYKLTVVIPVLLIIVLIVIGAIIAISTEELSNG